MQYSNWVSFLSAVSVPSIALIVAFIAFQQWRTARNKLKLDLFDKRMAVYQSVRDTLGTVVRSGALTQDEEINYLAGIQTAKWLFRPVVVEYLEKTLWHRLVDLGLHNTMSTERGNLEERTKHIHLRAETMKWLMSQYTEFDTLCAPDMQLRH